MSQTQDILIVAGEASADLHGAHLLKELKALIPDARFFGVGGESLQKEGLEIVVRAERLNVVGGTDWFDRISDVLAAYREVKREVDRRAPRLAILLDLPDFNLKLARHLKRRGTRVVYYISPQVWAWRKYRVRTISRCVDKMLVLFPFEKQFYDQAGIDATFVGHPVLDQMQRRKSYREQADILQNPRVAVLPGSRPSELKSHAELLRGFGSAIRTAYPTVELRVPVASTVSIDAIRALLPELYWTFNSNSSETLRWADVAVVASGTATLETALLGTPFCLFYKLSRSTAWIIRNIIRYRRFFGMPNLLHGKEVVREFLQAAATPEALLSECKSLIENEGYRNEVAVNLAHCWELLGAPGASQRAAREVCRVWNERPLVEGVLVHAPA